MRVEGASSKEGERQAEVAAEADGIIFQAAKQCEWTHWGAT